MADKKGSGVSTQDTEGLSLQRQVNAKQSNETSPWEKTVALFIFS